MIVLIIYAAAAAAAAGREIENYFLLNQHIISLKYIQIPFCIINISKVKKSVRKKIEIIEIRIKIKKAIKEKKKDNKWRYYSIVRI